MKNNIKKSLMITLAFLLLFLSGCSNKRSIILEDINDVYLSDWTSIEIQNDDINDLIDEVVVRLNNEVIDIDYNYTDSQILEFISVESLLPATQYLFTILFDSGKHYKLNFFTVSQEIDDESNLDDKLFILPIDDDYDVDEVELMKARILSVSPEVLLSLYRAGVKMKFTNGPITDEPELNYLKGEIPRGWEGLGLTWEDVPGAGGYDLPIARIGYSDPTYDNNHGAVNLELHEFGHTVDNYITGEWAKNSLSVSEEFIKIWNAEVDNVLFDEYFINYSEEYFAEVFAMYYLNKDTRLELKTYAPLTYNYMKNLDQFVQLED